MNDSDFEKLFADQLNDDSNKITEKKIKNLQSNESHFGTQYESDSNQKLLFALIRFGDDECQVIELVYPDDKEEMKDFEIDPVNENFPLPVLKDSQS